MTTSDIIKGHGSHNCISGFDLFFFWGGGGGEGRIRSKCSLCGG